MKNRSRAQSRDAGSERDRRNERFVDRVVAQGEPLRRAKVRRIAGPRVRLVAIGPSDGPVLEPDGDARDAESRQPQREPEARLVGMRGRRFGRRGRRLERVDQFASGGGRGRDGLVFAEFIDIDRGGRRAVVDMRLEGSEQSACTRENEVVARIDRQGDPPIRRSHRLPVARDLNGRGSESRRHADGDSIERGLEGLRSTVREVGAFVVSLTRKGLGASKLRPRARGLSDAL